MKKILLIDDDPDILEAVQYLLRYKGFTVEASEIPAPAEKLLLNNNSLPDLIILDILLSGKDGRKIAGKLKHNKKTQHIPIIMLSAHPSADKTIIDCGANEFLAKPFDINDLIVLIKKHI